MTTEKKVKWYNVTVCISNEQCEYLCVTMFYILLGDRHDTNEMCVRKRKELKKNNNNWLFHCVLSLCLIWHYYFLSSFTTPSHSLCRSLIFMRIFLWLGYMERKWKKCEIPQKKLFIGPFFEMQEKVSFQESVFVWDKNRFVERNSNGLTTQVGQFHTHFKQFNLFRIWHTHSHSFAHISTQSDIERKRMTERERERQWATNSR